MAALRSRRWFAPVLIGLVAGSLAGANAASVAPIAADDAAAGGSTIPRCDPDGFTAASVSSGADLISVTVGDIAPECATGEMTVSVVDADGVELATGGPVELGIDDEVVVSLAPVAATADVDAFHLVVTVP